MSGVVKVTKGEAVYAYFFPAKMPVEGIQFLTQQTDDFQIGLMERAKGYAVKPHTHPSVERTLTSTSEFLYLEQGKIKVTVYDEEWSVLQEETLESGAFLLFLRGGHSIDVLEDCRMLEVKQGPYAGDEMSKSFRPEQ